LNTLQVCGVFTGGAQTTLTSQIKPDVAEVVELAGTSGGSIVATLFASGMPLDILRELCMTLD
jgi:NTE family protein